MDRPLRYYGTPSGPSGDRLKRLQALTLLDIRRRRVVCSGHCAEGVAVAKVQRAELRSADARRVRQHGLKHWLKLAGVNLR